VGRNKKEAFIYGDFAVGWSSNPNALTSRDRTRSGYPKIILIKTRARQIETLRILETLSAVSVLRDSTFPTPIGGGFVRDETSQVSPK